MAQNQRPYGNQNRQESGVALYTASDVMVPEGFKENVNLIIQTYAKDLTPAQFSLFLADAHSRGMSITKRQIYATAYKGKLTVMVGIDGYRSTAEDHPDYAGQDGPYWCGSDGIWKDVWLSSQNPAAAKVGVFRKGFQAPVYGIALWSEYAKPERDTWKSLPTIMLAKCAEAQAIRKAFPAKLGGTYIPEEMDQANAISTTGRVLNSSAEPAVTANRNNLTPITANGQRPRHEPPDNDEDAANPGPDGEWNRASAALHAWGSNQSPKVTHEHMSAAAREWSDRGITGLKDLSARQLRSLQKDLGDWANDNRPELMEWLEKITPPAEPEVIETDGRLPGVDAETGEVIDTEALAAHHRR